MSQIAEVMKLARDLVGLARRMGGVVPVDISDLPVKALAAGIADRGDQLGLVWRLVPGTIGTPGTGGEMQVTLDGDTTSIPATSMIGRLPVGARVFVILSPPAGVHIVGFMGYDFPPSVPGEAIGRSRLIGLSSAFVNNTTTFQPTNLTFQAAANAVYEIRLRAAPSAHPDDDYKIEWSVPSGAGMDRYAIYPSNTNAGSQLNVTPVGFPRTGTGSVVGGGVLAGVTHSEDCYLRTLATGGAVTVRFAKSATTTANTCQLLANSYMIVQRYR